MNYPAKQNGTNVVTSKVRFSFPVLAAPKANEDGEKPRYALCVIIDGNDQDTIDAINAGTEEAIKKGMAEKWKGQRPKGLKLPLRDGTDERDGDEFQGNMFLQAYANADRQPEVVDADRLPILNVASEVYPGIYGRVSLNFYPFEFKGKKGVAVGLKNVQVLEDGERLGGHSSSAEDDFADD